MRSTDQRPCEDALDVAFYGAVTHLVDHDLLMDPGRRRRHGALVRARVVAAAKSAAAASTKSAASKAAVDGGTLLLVLFRDAVEVKAVVAEHGHRRGDQYHRVLAADAHYQRQGRVGALFTHRVSC
jgi:hypothetical protein